MSTSRATYPVETRLSLLEEEMETLIGNGRPGVIQRLEDAMAEIKATLFKARYIFLGCSAALMIMLMLTGSGVVSLKALLELVKP